MAPKGVPPQGTQPCLPHSLRSLAGTQDCQTRMPFLSSVVLLRGEFFWGAFAARKRVFFASPQQVSFTQRPGLSSVHVSLWE